LYGGVVDDTVSDAGDVAATSPLLTSATTHDSATLREARIVPDAPEAVLRKMKPSQITIERM